MSIESRELGFTKPGHYIYELLADLNITHETATKIIDIIEEAVVLLEEDKQNKAKATGCRLESISDILKIIFREKNNSHANFYRVSLRFYVLGHRIMLDLSGSLIANAVHLFQLVLFFTFY